MTKNLEDRFESLDSLTASELRVEVARRVRDRSERAMPGPGGRGRLTAAVLALVVFGAAAAFSWSIYERNQGALPATPTDPWSWAGEGWTELPPPPEWRDGASILWTDSQLLYWGGVPHGADPDASPSADGFAFDPVRKSWHRIAAAPVGGSNAHAVWTGSEALFWDADIGGALYTDVDSSDGVVTLAYDPANDTWRRLPDDPHGAPWGGDGVWTGRELVVFGGGRPEGATSASGAALDLATGTWRTIADAPEPMSLANAVWTGSQVIVVGSALDPGNHATTNTAVAEAYDPVADAWRQLPPAPLSPQASEAVWFSGEVVAWDYGSDSARFIPDQDRWQGLGKLPLDHGECYVEGVALRDAVFAWNCGYPDAWYPAVGWSDVMGGPGGELPVTTVVGTYGRSYSAGSVAIVWNLDNVERNGNVESGSWGARQRLWVWRPDPSPPTPSQSTWEDAENLTDNFLVAWLGYETYLPTLAAKNVIDSCRNGTNGLPSFAGGAFPDWNTERPTEIRPGTFEGRVELLQGDKPEATVIFTMGPGTAADGGDVQLVITDVRLA